mgnify:CR=1 FL=1
MTELQWVVVTEKMAAGKQATKGQKQIYAENLATIRYYAIMAALGCVSCFGRCSIGKSMLLQVIHLSIQTLLFEPTGKDWVLFALSTASQIGALFFMKTMAKATFSAKGVEDAGLDLNVEGGFGE